MIISRFIIRHSSRLLKSVNCSQIKRRDFRSSIVLKMNSNLKEFILENNSPFEQLEVTEAFDNLSEKEKNYLHYFTKVNELLMRCRNKEQNSRPVI
jgi:hypothetical protein